MSFLSFLSWSREVLERLGRGESRKATRETDALGAGVGRIRPAHMQPSMSRHAASMREEGGAADSRPACVLRLTTPQGPLARSLCLSIALGPGPIYATRGDTR
jgi:hypothetical protein